MEQWLRDRSELEAALEEDFGWRYIRMTCDTTNEKLLQDFQYFATEIEPKIAPINNELNKKFIENPFTDELEHSKYFVYIRSIKKALELFKNVLQLTEQERFIAHQIVKEITDRLGFMSNVIASASASYRPGHMAGS